MRVGDGSGRSGDRGGLPVVAELCEVCGLVREHARGRGSSLVIAESAPMRAVLQRAGRFARSSAPVVVFGESGTGKEVVARALHASGPRADKPFVAVNVAALPAELLESELFGHARGAFTGAAAAHAGLFEAAAGGTLFLDEIAEMPLVLQAKLLRALQDGEVRRVGESRSFAVDVRIVCATHRDLLAEVRAGRFREDLYFRLKVLALRVPPLRERPADILPLVERFLVEAGRVDGASLRVSRPVRDALVRYPWPGNARELHNAVSHALALVEGDTLLLEHLPEEIVAAPGIASPSPSPSPSGSLSLSLPAGQPGPRALADVEREHVLRTLEACGGSIGEAARVLGIGRNTLWRKLRRFA